MMWCFFKYRMSAYCFVGMLVLSVGCSASNSEIRPASLPEIEASSPSSTRDVQKHVRQRSPQQPFDPLTSVVAPGHLILMNCEEDPNLNGEFRVEHDGVLKLPYYIMVNVRGMTQPDLHAAILSVYRDYFQSPPAITIRVVEQKYSISVQGLVATPGEYLFKKDATLDELIAAAGGVREVVPGRVAARFVSVEQDGVVEMVKMADYYAGVRELPFEWKGGEVVFFQSEAEGEYSEPAHRNYVQVIGQVTTPGEILYEPGADFFYYLARVGGPTERAGTNNIDLIRSAQGGAQTITFDLKEPTSIPKILPGDIVLVNTERSSFYIAISSIVSALATAIIAAVAL